MSKCNKSEAQAIDYVYGELDSNQADDYITHLASCNQCTRKVNTFQRVLHLIDEAEEAYAPQASAPSNLQAKLYKRLASEKPVKTSFQSRLLEFSTNIPIIMQKQKIACISFFTITVITIVFFVGNPFQHIQPLNANPSDSPNAGIEQYRHKEIQRKMEDVLRNQHLRNSDRWDTVSQLNRVKDQAKGTNWAIIANQQLKNVNSDL